MNVLITGANGTLGRVLHATLSAKRHTVSTWDRNRVPIDSYQAIEDHLRQVSPDVVFHLAIASQSTGRANEGWLVNYEWPSEMAWAARTLGVPIVFTSSVMVFTDNARGPFLPDSEPDAESGYGFEKRRAERRVLSQNPLARVARLGWQIGSAPGTNNMVDYLDRTARTEGRIRASTRWMPACSFLEDTALVLARLLDQPPGLYQIDSNRGWNFFEIATALRERLAADWVVEPSEDFVYDQRMLDERLRVPPLRDRLPPLRELV